MEERMSDVIETDSAEVLIDENGIPEHVNNYKVTKFLGEGAYSKVYLCERENVLYAMKILNKSFLRKKREFKRVNGVTVTSNALQKVQKEIAIMKKLQHKNLTKMYEIIDSPDEDKIFMILEYVSGGQLLYWDETEHRYKNNKKYENKIELMAKNCISDLILGIEYLHANNICHRDIKPENILMDDKGTFKLGDFGVAHMFSSDEIQELQNTEGTYHFLAPECTTGDSYDPFKVDIWALGITLYVLLYGILPFGKVLEDGVAGILNSIRFDPLHFPSILEGSSLSPEKDNINNEISTGYDHPKPFQDLISRMLDRNVQTRITINQLKEHKWLIENEKIIQSKSSVLPGLVQVSAEEIELAFTPVNDFILMTKIKLRMSNRLAKLRVSLKDKDNKSPLSSPTNSPEKNIINNNITNENSNDELNLSKRNRLSDALTIPQKKKKNCIIS